eukprot:764082-Hanusia_phi.AAC.1
MIGKPEECKPGEYCDLGVRKCLVTVITIRSRHLLAEPGRTGPGGTAAYAVRLGASEPEAGASDGEGYEPTELSSCEPSDLASQSGREEEETAFSALS